MWGQKPHTLTSNHYGCRYETQHNRIILYKYTWLVRQYAKQKKSYKGSVRPLTIAVLGCGKMGRHHIQAIQLQKYAKLVAVAVSQADQSSLNILQPCLKVVQFDLS